MSIRVKKLPPALKHGAYSATGILPGEDPVAFRKLHHKLIAELRPIGALEDDIIATMARLLWRKQNLATFRIAELARARCSAIEWQKVPRDPPPPLEFDFDDLLPPAKQIDTAEREAALRAAKDQARKELEDAYRSVEIGKTASIERLFEELEAEERLDAMIDKCLKRLLFLRGLKSLPTASSSAPPQPIPEPRRIPGATKAA
jgi:uncharacterized membrane protein YccC